MSTSDGLVSTVEAAARLGVSQSQVKRLVGPAGLVATNPSGRRWFIDEHSIERVLAHRQPEVISEQNETLIAANLASLRFEGFAPGSVYQRDRSLRRLLAAVGDVSLLEVTPVQIEARLAAIPGVTGRRTELAHLRRFYEWCIDYEHLNINPCRRLRPPKVPRRLPRPISETDLTDALDAAPTRIRPWLLLAGWAGLRCKEVAQLRAEDIEWTCDPPVLMVRDGKGGKDGAVPMSPWLVDQLRACNLPSSGYLFRRQDGQPGHIPPHLVSHLGAQHLRSVDIDATMHQLRHRFGTQAHRATGDLRITQELMRHATPVSTAIYTHVDTRSTYAAVNALPTTSTPPP